MRSNTDTPTNGQFLKGLVSGFVLVFVLGVAASVAKWFIGHPFVARLQQALMMPLFSVYDILSALMFLLILFVVIYMLAYGPRMK